MLSITIDAVERVTSSLMNVAANKYKVFAIMNVPKPLNDKISFV
jgi:hypothetical protein